MQIGAEKLGYSFFNVQPGKTAFPYHTHTGNEEMIYIIDGTGDLAVRQRRDTSCRAGDVIACPPGADYPASADQHGCNEF